MRWLVGTAHAVGRPHTHTHPRHKGPPPAVRPVEAARFPHRALAALAPLRRGPYAAKLPVTLHATGARPLATRYRTAIPDKLAPLLSSEPAPVFEADEVCGVVSAWVWVGG